MKKYLVSTTILILLLSWPALAQEQPVAVSNGSAVAERILYNSETNYLNKLALLGFNLQTQGLLIETLDGTSVLADHYSDVAFNPASVIKVATSYAALHQWGPNYEFETAFYADGVLDKKTNTLKGNLVFRSTGDPLLRLADVKSLIAKVIRAGITRVTGNLVVTGPFTVDSTYTTDAALKRVQTALKSQGVRIAGTMRKGPLVGSRVATHLSSSLRDIVLTQNRYSSNPTAERLGAALGGPKAVHKFLVEVVDIPVSEVVVGQTSGLGYNRITARGTVQLFRRFVYWLGAVGLEPKDVLPVAGVDVGTLHSRFTEIDFRDGIVGKTGTLPATDGGVSALAGIAYTKDRGPILFAIFNTGGSVATYRKLQDSLVKDLITECGGIVGITTFHKSGN